MAMGSSEQVQSGGSGYHLSIAWRGNRSFRFSAAAPTGAPAGAGVLVQTGNCTPNHPFRHPLICLPHANTVFLQMINIFVASPFYLKQNT